MTTIFITFALLSALFVISSTNPVHSVFALIALFINSSALLFTLQADFLGILILVVYVGAIAILFLFVVMMLHLNLALFHDNLLRYLPIGTFVGISFLIFSFIFCDNYFLLPILQISYLQWQLYIFPISSAILFSDTLYTYFSSYFIIASLILFVAMIGAIVLTHDTYITKFVNHKKQDTINQLIRDYQNTIIIK